MQDNRNTSHGCCGSNDNRGTVCIDTRRVLDSCRDRDCFEDTRVYLTSYGEEIIASATNVRTRSAKIVCAYVGVEPVPFNCGFYRVTIRYYVKVEFEACTGIGRSQTFCGIAVLEKDVILYGGEGKVVTFSSNPNSSFCDPCATESINTNDPIAMVETAEPIVLGTKVVDTCSQSCCCCECCEMPETVTGVLDGELITNSNGHKILVSLGIFSIIRIERQAQILVQATDYSIPDKECINATNDDNPCALFGSMAFPVNQFKTTTYPANDIPSGSNGCGCGK